MFGVEVLLHKTTGLLYKMVIDVTTDCKASYQREANVLTLVIE